MDLDSGAGGPLTVLPACILKQRLESTSNRCQFRFVYVLAEGLRIVHMTQERLSQSPDPRWRAVSVIGALRVIGDRFQL